MIYMHQTGLSVKVGGHASRCATRSVSINSSTGRLPICLRPGKHPETGTKVRGRLIDAMHHFAEFIALLKALTRESCVVGGEHASFRGWLRVTKFSTPSGAVAGFAVDINENKERESALNAQIETSKTLEKQLRELANTDSLTGLPNRRAFLERLETEFTRVGRYGEPLSVIMMDIDNSKLINDVHGHSFGDDVIAGIAATAASTLRTPVDLIGRLGGEEFAVLLPATGADGAAECAERMRIAVADIPFEAGGEPVRVTASFGIAAVAADDQQGSDVVSRADSALYRAKTGGRNRAMAWQAGGQ